MGTSRNRSLRRVLLAVLAVFMLVGSVPMNVQAQSNGDDDDGDIEQQSNNETNGSECLERYAYRITRGDQDPFQTEDLEDVEPGDQLEVLFRIADSCEIELTLASWETDAADEKNVTEEELFDHDSDEFEEGRGRLGPIDVPPCFFRVAFLYGELEEDPRVILLIDHVRSRIIDEVYDGESCEPQCPSDFEATVLLNGDVHLTWEPGDNAPGYRIFRRADGGSFQEIGAVRGHVDNFTDDNTTRGTAYTYVITLVNEEGRVIERCARDSVTVPQAKCPTDFEAFVLRSGDVRLTWVPGENASGYRIFRQVGNGSFEEIAAVRGHVDEFTDNNTTVGATYTYVIALVNERGQVIERCGRDTVTVPEPRCVGPTNIQATANENETILVTWDGINGEDGYNVYRKAGAGSFEFVAHVDAPTQSYLDQDVTAGVTYTYTVTATRGEAESDRCDMASATAIPVFPSLLAASMAVFASIGAYGYLRRRR